MHVIHESVNWNRLRNEWMSPNTFDVVNDSLALIPNRQPLDEFAGTRPWPMAHVAESIRRQFGRLQTRSQQFAHDVTREKLHPAIGVMNDKEFPRPQQLVADHERADGVVTGAPARIANYVGISLGETGILGGIEPGIHTGENREATSRRQSQLPFLCETRAVLSVCLEHFRQNLAHGNLLSPNKNAALANAPAPT